MSVYDIDWGMFSLVEFIVSCSLKIGKQYKSCLDIGSGAGIHTAILREAGLEVFQLDKYSENAEYKEDFLTYDFERKFDVIFTSHVIEHQRNVGLFLDKIHDILSDDGLLIITAPKHSPETLIEGHIACFYTAYFVQNLIHAGFDCKEGKYMSCGGIENTAIVPKAKNFDPAERLESGWNWTEKHQARCFFKLENRKIPNNVAAFHNCFVFGKNKAKSLEINIPSGYKKRGITIKSDRWGIEYKI